jgi:Tol biopolymer transport system component
MSQQPPGPPPQGYPSDPGYPDPNYPPQAPDPNYSPQAPDPNYPQQRHPEPGQTPQGHVQPGYAEPVQPAQGFVEPQYLPPAYPPGGEPGPPRRQESRSSPLLIPVLALLGLVLVGGASIFGFSFLSSTLDEAAGADASATPAEVAVIAAVATEQPSGASETEAPTETAAPTETVPPEEIEVVAPPVVVEAPPGEAADINGSLLFTRLGDVWKASGRQLQRLTDSASTKSDSSPAWSPDGRFIYFIRTGTRETSRAKLEGKYTLEPTDLMRMKADGSDRKVIYESLFNSGGLWFRHVLQPTVSPNGTTVAVASDGPDGQGAVELHVINNKTKRMNKVPASGEGDLGHNDPAFSPDGTRIAYTYNDNRGTEGLPKIGIFTCATRANCSRSKGRPKLLKPGFANPSWSPDATWLAVEATEGVGRDIAIISSRRGDVRLRLTDDRNSFAPAVSPDGNQIAYLHREGTDINLRVMTLDVSGNGKITLVSDQAVTVDGLVDGESSPSWYIPKNKLSNPDPVVDSGEAVDASGESLDPGDAPATEAPAGDDSAASEGAPPPPGL